MKGDYQKVNIFLKRKGDEGVAKELDGLKAQYKKWNHRVEQTKENFVEEFCHGNVLLDLDDDDDNSNNNLAEFADVCLKIMPL